MSENDALSESRGRTIQERLSAWYRNHKRKLPWRETRDPYKIWVSEVMLQQTQVKTVIPYYLSFLVRFPRLEDLARADLSRVLKQWEGLGYYARARNLHRAALRVLEDLGGVIPDEYKDFKALPGVGDYIACAVLSIAHNRPLAVVDGNVKRVLARLFCMADQVNTPASHKVFKSVAEMLLDKNDPANFNQAVMELGALVCTPKGPGCSECPLQKCCRSFGEDRVSEFPKRRQTKTIPCHHISVGLVQKGDKLLITRRSLDGLLGGLWEFPGGKVEKNESARDACIREIREETAVEARAVGFLTRVTHAYTHFRIEMDVYYCDYISGEVVLNGPIDFMWARLSDLGDFAFPKANLKFIPLIQIR